MILFKFKDPAFEDIYYMPFKDVTFDLLDEDNEPPIIINNYIFNMNRNFMNFRISSSESATTYYLLTLDGTNKPT